jgi:hypothetical protein
MRKPTAVEQVETGDFVLTDEGPPVRFGHVTGSTKVGKYIKLTVDDGDEAVPLYREPGDTVQVVK